MGDNVYKTPESNLIQESSDEAVTLASRWQRLGASLLDGLSIGLVTFPLMYFTGGFDGISSGVQPSIGYTLLMAVAALAVFFMLNARLLIRSGQTIGKKVMGIKIVNLDDNLPDIKSLFIRYFTYFIPGQIPMVGQLFSVINILFIFGKPKRCLHDHFAATRVVLN